MRRALIAIVCALGAVVVNMLLAANAVAAGQAIAGDPDNLVASPGPSSTSTILQQIDELGNDVDELSLRRSLDRFLGRLLRRASAPLKFCVSDRASMSSQSKRWNRYRKPRGAICKNDGEDKAVQRLRLFAWIIEIFKGWKISADAADALIAKTNLIIDELLREPPASGLYTLTSLGEERSYYLRVPENYSEYGDPLPIIFALHGATGSYLDWFEGGFQGDGLQNVVGDQAIMVFPNAAVGNGGITLWNRNTDFDYFANVMAILRSQLLIDPNRIFVTGHSAGGGFTHELGCRFGDIIRAIAPSSGALTGKDCVGSVAVLQMQSSEDMVTPIGIVQLSRNFWAAYNGFNRDVFSDGITEPCIDYSLGASLYSVQWCMHASTGENGHQWWDKADETVWDFFSSLPVAEPTTEPPPGGGNDNVMEDFTATLSFTVRYPEDINPVTMLSAVLYPAGTEQPITNAPTWFLASDIPTGPATPGTVQSYVNVPANLVPNVPFLPLPGSYTLSINAFVEGGSFPIPAFGIDHLALYQVEIQDHTSPIVVDEVLDLVPVGSF